MTISAEFRARRGTIPYLFAKILLTTKLGSGLVWQRSLTEFIPSKWKGSNDKSLGVIPSEGEESFLMTKVGCGFIETLPKVVAHTAGASMTAGSICLASHCPSDSGPTQTPSSTRILP
jgi:hypothetical protein